MYISKRLGMDHSFTCKYTMPAFISVHQMAPPLTEVGDIQLTTYLSTQKG